MSSPRSVPNAGIKQRLLRRILALEILLLAVAAFVQVVYEYNGQMDGVRELLRDLDRIHRQGMVNALWDMDKGQIVSQLKGIMNAPNIVYAAIQIQDGDTIEVGNPSAQNVISSESELTYRYRGRDVPLGSFRIHADTSNIMRDALMHALNALLIYALVLFVSTLLLIVFVDKFAIHHLASMANQIRSFRPGDPHSLLQLDKPHFGDEIDILAATFNDQQEQIQNGYQKLLDMQADLVASAEKFRTVADYTYNWEYWRAPDSQMVWVSPACERVTGYTPEEFMNDKLLFRSIVHPEDKHQLNEHIEKIDGGFDEFCSMELRIITRSKETKWLQHECLNIVDPGGKRLGRRVCNRDITERKQAELALNESVRKFKGMFDSAPIGILLFDSRGVVIDANPFIETIFATPRGKYSGLCLPEAMPDSTHRQAVLDGIQNGVGWAEGWYKSIFSSREFCLKTRVNQISADLFMVFLEDVTLARELELSLAKALEAAESANKAKSAFLANMSHEIRTPLNGILGMLQLLEIEDCSPVQAEYVGMAKSASKRLLRLLSDILDISRIEAGKMAITIEPFNPRELLDETVNLYARDAAIKGISLSGEAASGLPVTILGDQARVAQILFNLVGNAVKFTVKGEVRVDLSLKRLEHDPDQAVLLITVADTGPGITDDNLPRLFHPFTQSECSFTRKYQGAGLGLAIVRRLASLMGGSVCVESEEGLGTTFYVAIRSSVPPAKRSCVSIITKSRTGPGRILHILVADDDDVSLAAAKKMLEKLGHVVHCAKDGKEACVLVEQGDIDCVLMDVQMPVINGVVATGMIRSMGKPFSDVPIVAMTAYAMTGDKEKFLAAGIDDYIAKPVEMIELEAVIQRVMEKKQSSQAAAPIG